MFCWAMLKQGLIFKISKSFRHSISKNVKIHMSESLNIKNRIFWQTEINFVSRLQESLKKKVTHFLLFFDESCMFFVIVRQNLWVFFLTIFWPNFRIYVNICQNLLFKKHKSWMKFVFFLWDSWNYFHTFPQSFD